MYSNNHDVVDLILFITLGVSTTIPWVTRLKIAIGAAKGLAFLHCAEIPVIYRDFKTSNILLDSVLTFTLLFVLYLSLIENQYRAY